MPKFFVDGSSGDVNFGYEATGTTPKLTWDASAESVSLDSAVVINESGADVDFRIESDTNANAFFLEGSSGNVGLGTSSPTTTLGGLDISSGGNGLIVGADVNASTRTNNATKVVRIGYPHYSTSEQPVALFIADSSSTENLVYIGGGGSAFNTATKLLFYTAANNTTTNGSEAMRIDSSGNLLVGKTSADNTTAGLRVYPGGNVVAVVDGANPINANRLSSDGEIIRLQKDSSTVGSIGSSSTGGGSIVIGNASSGIMFRTDLTTSAFIPANPTTFVQTDNTLDVGHSAIRFDDIYATNGTIQTSDRNEKQDIEELSEAEQRVAVAAKGLLRKYRWKDSVAEKGDEARIHFGIIAQDLQAAFEAEGLDAGRYGMFIYSTWWETYTDVPAVEAVEAVYETQTDEEGNEVQVLVSEAVEAKEAYTRTDTHDEPVEGATEKSRMGIRYPELLAFIIAAI